jgi:NAD(P)-dependent dehydrogenase (short-subunit alcohol dehydrogenase family)
MTAAGGFQSDPFEVENRCRRYEGRVAIVTGGAQGLGRVTARRLGAEGASVVIADLQKDRAQASAEQLAGQTGSEYLAVAGDLSTRDGADALATATLERFGRIDTFVGSAAYQARRPFLDATEEQMTRSFDANVWALVRPLRAIIPAMMARRYGRIVTVGGLAFEAGSPWHAFLAGVGKGSVVGLTSTLAGEFGGFGITVNCVSPGGMETRNDGTPDSAAGGLSPELNPSAEEIERYQPPQAGVGRSVLPRGRAHPSEVAAAIAFFGSPEASFVTGQLLKVSAGAAML